MTCVVGFIDHKGNGHIASDSIGSDGYTKHLYKNKKIFRKDGFLFGYTSSYRMGQLLEHTLQLPKRKESQSLSDYMYNDFIEAVRKLLKQHGYAKVDNNKECIGTFLVVTEGRIFKVQDDLSILEGYRFMACGSGEDFALGAMDVLTRSEPKFTVHGESVLKHAIEVAAKYVTTVGGDVDVLTERPVRY